jgi:hypothetical protein
MWKQAIASKCVCDKALNLTVKTSNVIHYKANVDNTFGLKECHWRIKLVIFFLSPLDCDCFTVLEQNISSSFELRT